MDKITRRVFFSISGQEKIIEKINVSLNEAVQLVTSRVRATP
jgi:hypothetical protein